jgi:4-hydroxythreonine-4-phosphate dehydrogenase
MLGITMGDASGIGPEIALMAYKKGEFKHDFVVVGDSAILERCNQLLNLQVPLRPIATVEEHAAGALNVLDLGLMAKDDLEIGTISKKTGHAALRYVQRAAELALAGAIDAMVTLPMNKEATQLSEPNFTGHTEFIAELCGQRDVTMMLASERLIVTHVSTHVSLQQAIAQVKQERILKVIELTHEAVRRLRPRTRIAVAGLNPHAGEHGAFGREDLEEIAPAIEQARRAGYEVFGPEPGDTVFYRAVARHAFDAVVCMYHDQGHIPMKLLDFEGGVNVTLGLPIIRTSVDHGTAFDIAYQGIASTQSIAKAFEMAANMVTGAGH